MAINALLVFYQGSCEKAISKEEEGREKNAGRGGLFEETAIRTKEKALITARLSGLFAEREGFEPPEVLPSTVFKTAAIDHSAISPAQK